MTTRIPTYNECRVAGMTMKETAAARGVTPSACCTWAKKNRVKFVSGYPAPEDAMKKFIPMCCADCSKVRLYEPSTAKRFDGRDYLCQSCNMKRRAKTRPIKSHAHLEAMSHEERAAYDCLRKRGDSMAEALSAMGLA